MSTTISAQQAQSNTEVPKGHGTARLVPSGKVYRQLFEAQVQFSEAYDKVKEKYRENPPAVRITEENIPLVQEGRHLRGNGFLTNEGKNWISTETNDLYAENPVFYKYKTETNKVKLSKIKKTQEKETVLVLPDTVVAGSKGSDIETRIENSRRKKHNETWEDMIQEIALVNLNLEPEIKKTGRTLLAQLNDDDQEVETLLSILKEDDSIIINGSNEKFENLRHELLFHTEKRKQFIDQMDNNYLRIENERVEKIRSIFSSYADKLFNISYYQRPRIEKMLDNEIQLLNNQILVNKTCYAELYAKLITADIEREKNQFNLIDVRFKEWRTFALGVEINNLEKFIENMNMISLRNDPNAEDDHEQEQKKINANRLGLIDALKSFKPHESTKSAAYKWFDSLNEQTKILEQLNTNYVNKLQISYEESNQKIINKMENTLEYLINNRIVDETNSKEVLEEKLLPIWSRKQKQIEEFIENVEVEFDQLNQLLKKEVTILFKYIQGIGHIWDMHEIGLIKKERALQELLQDCRKDHDNDNQKREEKLDSILDQIREASTEKDLKRLLTNVGMQLDAIKRGYLSFKEAQLELIKQYPQMVKEELRKYEHAVYRFFSVLPEAKLDKLDKDQEESSTEEISSSNFRKILKEVLSTDKGTKFYVTLKSARITADSSLEKNETDQIEETPEETANDILGYDELIPNTKDEILDKAGNRSYLRNSYIPVELFKDIKDLIRINFLNHLESWLEEASVRATSIVAAKSDEIEKELELRLHLHEPRMKRAEMDVHNVRASELIMHEERVERHCSGIEEAIDNMQKQFINMQNNLNEMANNHKSDVLNLEVAFNNATKSLRLIALQEQLSKQRDKHMENVKVTLRNFRVKFDDTLSYLRNSNAKFRFSFNVFSDGGNFSADEIETHKKKLEKMASLIDTNETNMLKDMEKLEKKHLDEAIKVMAQFQDKFKYHLVDLQFIEKISRWLNDTQVKIKTEVNASNSQAKTLNKMINDFEVRIDACKFPNLDKPSVSPNDLIECFDQLNKSIYERASYLKCFKDENIVPIHLRGTKYKRDNSPLALLAKSIVHQGNIASAVSSANRNGTAEQTPPSNTVVSINAPPSGPTDSTSSLGQKSKAQTPANNILKSSSRVMNEDPALSIIKNILKNNKEELAPVKENSTIEQIANKSQTSMSQSTMKKSKKNEKLSKVSNKSSISSSNNHENSKNQKLLAVAEVYKIIEERRAKTRDEMYAYYCTFGEHRNPGQDFMANVTNVLRDSLEGILTNSEMFYREIQQQNRQVTRSQTIKESYPEFAEAMIHKLKSYYSQCEVYHNQCLKEFRESLVKYEIFSSEIPELLMLEIFNKNKASLLNDMQSLRNVNLQLLKEQDVQRVTTKSISDQIKTVFNELILKEKNETSLKPNLGHPNMRDKLEVLNKTELKRQEINSKTIDEFVGNLKLTIQNNSSNFLKDLSKANESLLIKFDDLLCVDDVNKHEMIPEKHPTSELIKRQLAGLSLEDPEEEPLIRREKGKWKGVENYVWFKDDLKSQPSVSATVNTAKTTLAHQKSSDVTTTYHQKFKKIIEENLNYIDTTEKELSVKLDRWVSYWASSIESIKNLYN